MSRTALSRYELERELELQHIQLQLEASRRIHIEEHLLELQIQLADLSRAFREHQCSTAIPGYAEYPAFEYREQEHSTVRPAGPSEQPSIWTALPEPLPSAYTSS